MYKDATIPEIEMVMQQAWKAFPIYRKYSLKKRADFLRAIAKEIEELGDELLKVTGEETNLPEVRLRGERGRTIFQLNQYADACEKGDIVEIADALGDQLYILFGTMLKHGLQHKMEEVFDEIQRSNMSKLDEQGNPIFREDGKILKSNLYFRPNIKDILEK